MNPNDPCHFAVAGCFYRVHADGSVDWRNPGEHLWRLPTQKVPTLEFCQKLKESKIETAQRVEEIKFLNQRIRELEAELEDLKAGAMLEAQHKILDFLTNQKGVTE